MLLTSHTMTDRNKAFCSCGKVGHRAEISADKERCADKHDKSDNADGSSYHMSFFAVFFPVQIFIFVHFPVPPLYEFDNNCRSHSHKHTDGNRKTVYPSEFLFG